MALIPGNGYEAQFKGKDGYIYSKPIIAWTCDDVGRFRGLILRPTTPAAWQAPTTSAEIAVLINNGSTTTIIAGVTGQTIRIFSISLAFDTASIGNDLQLLDGGSGGTSIGRFSASTINPQSQNWFGRPLTSGNGFTLKANGANLTPRGVVVYSQA